jgi:hypothetical protein
MAKLQAPAYSAPIDKRSPQHQEPTMNTTLRFAKQESTIRRVAAALAVVMSLGLIGSIGEMADRNYDHLLMAQADAMPTHVVVVTAKRIQA